MSHEELKTALVKELIANPQETIAMIVCALNESAVGCKDLMGGYAESIGVTVGKKMADRMEEADRLNCKNGYKMKRWAEEGQKVYSINDFPQWVIDDLKGKGHNVRLLVNNAACQAMNDERAEPWFCILADGAHFTEDGYRYLIMTSEGRGWLGRPFRRQWQIDSGLYAEEDVKPICLEFGKTLDSTRLSYATGRAS